MTHTNFLGLRLNPIILFAGLNLLASLAALATFLALGSRLFPIVIDLLQKNWREIPTEEIVFFLSATFGIFLSVFALFTIFLALAFLCKQQNLRKTIFTCDLIILMISSLAFTSLSFLCARDKKMQSSRWLKVPGLTGPAVWFLITGLSIIVFGLCVFLLPHAGRKSGLECEEEGEDFDQEAALDIGRSNNKVDLCLTGI